MSKVILITGVMASGKSTAAQNVAEMLPSAVHLRGDVFRKMIVSGRVNMSEDAGEEAYSQLRLRYQITAEAAKRYAAAGFDVVIQDNYYGQMLPYMLGLLDGLNVKTIVLCPSAEAVEAREAQRNKKGYGGYDVKPLWESFMKETPRIGLWLDNTEFAPEETAQKIYDWIIQDSV